jgi:glycosyltransferase involved in cell wall biosynthesis
MHVYLYLKHFPPHLNPAHDGATKAVHGLALGLVSCGLAVTVLSEGPIAASDARRGYCHHCFPSPNTHPGLNLSAPLRAFLQQQLTPQDVVILNGGYHLSVYALSRWLKRRGQAYLVAPHTTYDPGIFRKKPYLKYPYWYGFERFVLRDAAAIQVLDRRQGYWLRKRGIKTAIIEVPNGFDAEDVPPESSLQWPDRPPQIFFFGRLSIYHKGIDLLIAAFAALPAADWGALIIQGPDVGERSRLQAQVRRLGLADRVKFLAPDYQTGASQLMAQHDIVCMPSRFEGFGFVALEAMLAGRVVLVSAEAGIAPHVQASGCGGVTAPQPEAIRAGLQSLLDQRERWPQMGLQGRQYALQHLAWPMVATGAIADYQAIMGQTRGAVPAPIGRWRI